MKKIFLALSLVITTLTASKSFAENIALAKATELACHRIERLVALKKIDESFLNHLGTMVIVTQTKIQPTDPAFRVVASKYPGADGKMAQLELMMDSQGKTLSFNVIAGSPSSPAPAWQDKDAVTLVESALHYILEGWQGTNPAVQPFYDDLKSLRISQVKNASGQIISKVEFWSNRVATVLEVNLNLDGSFISAEVK